METRPRSLPEKMEEVIERKLRDKRDDIFLKWNTLSIDKHITPDGVIKGKLDDLNRLRKNPDWLFPELEPEELEQFKKDGFIVDGKFPVRERRTLSRLVSDYFYPWIQKLK